MLYQKGKTKKGSPVRVFSNLRPELLVLPSSEYRCACGSVSRVPHSLHRRKCTVCNRFVSKENEHCSKCGVCPSKVRMCGCGMYVD